MEAGSLAAARAWFVGRYEALLGRGPLEQLAHCFIIFV